MMTARASILLSFVVLTVACSQSAPSPTAPLVAGGSMVASGDSPLAATVLFGNDSVGSGFPTPTGHDQSGHARDNLIPRTVVIDKGGTVTFQMGGGVHQVGIFADGTRPEDVIRTGAQNKPGCPAAGRYISGAANPGTFVAVTGDPLCDNTKPNVPIQSYTFQTPGTYLVICTFIPHLDLGMYGWVVVRDR
jgi:plastocyanin